MFLILGRVVKVGFVSFFLLAVISPGEWEFTMVLRQACHNRPRALDGNAELCNFVFCDLLCFLFFCFLMALANEIHLARLRATEPGSLLGSTGIY